LVINRDRRASTWRTGPADAPAARHGPALGARPTGRPATRKAG